jgi:hypothetical protein
MIPLRFPFRLLLAAAILLPAVCAAQIASTAEKRFEISRTNNAPDIDGIVDDAEWSSATRVTDMHQVIPVEFQPPSERTVWFLSYDDSTLFVAARAYDSDPDAIVARTLRQGGSLNADDFMQILVDAFNTKRSGYSFGLNPNGVRQDAIYTDGTRQSDDWEGIWRGAARLTEEGWSMEMAIPFNTLNFDPKNDTWGVNLWRKIARKNETVGWESRNGLINPTVSGEMRGLENLTQGKGLDVIPSASAVHLNDRATPSTHSEFNPSLDINYKIGNAVNALVTFNTDFAATEVDGRQLGLQRFGVFFPEKRSFFLTDFDIFQFGGVPTGGGGGGRTVGRLSGNNGLAFFSRRIGLSESDLPVDIIFGTKVSGRLGGFDFGSLYIKQDAFEDVGKKDLAVARVAHQVFGESTIGGIATYGDPQSNFDNSLVGLDFLYRNTRLSNNRTLENQWWIQKSNSEGVSGKDLAYNVSVALPARENFRAGGQFQVVEENFNPALGFANRTGVRLYAAELGYNKVFANTEILREFEPELRFSRWEFLDTGNIQSQRLEIIPLKMRSIAGDVWRLSAKLNTEGLLPGEQPLEDIGIFIPAGEYSFERYGSFLRSAGHRKFSFELWLEDGGYFNGDRLQISPEVSWRPNEFFGLEFEIDYNKYDFPGSTATTRQMTLKADFAFNSKLSLTTLAQYDNVSDDIGINARLRYNVEAGRDIWLVLNHSMVEDPLTERFRSTESLAVVKVRYTFRY